MVWTERFTTPPGEVGASEEAGVGGWRSPRGRPATQLPIARAVVVAVSVGAPRRRRRKHIGSSTNGAGCGAESPADNRTNWTASRVARSGSGGLALHRT